MLTLLSYFAFLMFALTLTPALFVGLNKIQIL
uniref:Cytochrome b6-f complex subunit 6 n=1 Tax=Llavea cordifolia TaxID=40966 RepID=A0A3G5CU25_9MONI|nr:cytochrome b6/f complex subunit VI [Llavea cordifolia]AYW16352.1 cytochrome b6/f complex subunit VI [Llavea cordifolia]